MIFLRMPPVDGFWTLTAAPILLIIGYIVLLPLGLRPGPVPRGAYQGSGAAVEKNRNIFWGGVGVFAVSFIIYIITLWPGPGWWDSAEYITSSYTLGVPSPPGSFMLQLIGRDAAALIPFLSPPIKINLLMGLFSSLAAVTAYLITVHVVRSFDREKSLNDGVLVFSGMTAALTLAFTHSVWCKATFANPYALSLLTGCLLIYLALLWWERADTPGGGNYLLLTALVLGLDLSVHRSNLLFAPFFVLLILIRRPRAYLDWRLWLGGILVFFIGMSMQLGLMFRAQLNPEINFGNPDTLRGFWDYFNLRQFDISIFGLDLFQRKGPFWSYQVKEMYLRYIGWNFIGLGGDGARIGFSGFSWMFGIPLLFGLVGVVVHFVRRWKQAVMLFLAFLFASLGAIYYLNVPAGFFREMDRHFVVSFMIISVWIGVAVYAALYYLPRLFGDRRGYSKPAFWIVTAIALLILPVNMIRANFNNNNMRENYTAYAFGRNLLDSCEKNAILITAGDSDTFTAWYSWMIEKMRPDITTFNIHLLNTPWYLRTLMTYHPDIPWTLTEDRIATLAPKQGAVDSVVVAGLDESTGSFGFLPESSYGREILLVADQVLIDIIKTNQWRRPVCFSFGFGENVPLGLRDYCRLDGLVWSLCPDEAERGDMSRLEENVFGYDYRGIGDYEFLDLTGRGMMNGYLQAIVTLATHYNETEDYEKFESLKLLFDKHWQVPGGLERFLGMGESGD